MKDAKNKAITSKKSFPIVKEIPKDHKGTSRKITKGKNKGHYMIFE